MTIVPVANDVDAPVMDVAAVDDATAVAEAPPTETAVDHPPMAETEVPDKSLPLLSVVVPAYNEALVIMQSLTTLYEYLQGLADQYRFELIVVDDGSADETGDIAEAFARSRPEVLVLRHRVNFRLGQALRFGINRSKGDYVVTFDSDLSYEPGHIGQLVTALREGHARIAIASPYMKGGKDSGLPWNRKVMSKGVNRILAASSQYDISTVTGLVRAYDGPFIRGLNLKSMGPEINTEILYKAQILRARVVEVPAHLDWTGQTERMKSRKVPLKVSTTSKLLMFSGFLFRPITVFLVPGLLLLAVALSTLGALLLTVWREFSAASGSIDSRLYEAFGTAWQVRPQTFVIGGISLVVAVQFISIGLLATQSKRNFEELFHLDSRLLRQLMVLDERVDALQSKDDA
jgi:glycosyltransferase involved in cell wall biosynthesis